MGLTDLALKAPREWLSKSFVLAFEMANRPATLPKLDNDVDFQLASMVNRLRYFASRERLYRVLVFSLCLMSSLQRLGVWSITGTIGGTVRDPAEAIYQMGDRPFSRHET